MKKMLLSFFTLMAFISWSQSISVTVNGFTGGYGFGDVEVGTSIDVPLEVTSTFTTAKTVFVLGEGNATYPGVDANSTNYCGGVEGAFVLLDGGIQISEFSIPANGTKTLTLRFVPNPYSYSKFVGFEQGCDPRDPQCGASGGGQIPICEPANSTSTGDYIANLLMNYNVASGGSNTISLNLSGKGIITTVGLSDASTNDLSLYPNPTSGKVNLTHDVEWSVKSLSGIVVLQGDGKTIEMSTLAEGVYFIEMNDGGLIMTDKVIKN